MKTFLAASLITFFLLPSSALALTTEETGLIDTGTRIYGAQQANTDIGTYIGSNILTPFFGILGLIFLILIIYGGLLWMMGGGNPDTVRKAKRILGSALIGLIIIMLAYGFTVFVFESITRQGVIGT